MSLEDGIEKVIGSFGRFQSWILFLVMIGRLPTDFQLTNVVFLIPNVNYECMDESAYNVTNYCPCAYPKYDQSAIVSSVTTEWNLICSRTSLASLAQSMMQIGILPGSLIFGHISDRYGRKMAILLSLLLTALFGAISAVIPHLWMFFVLRFLIGMTLGGSMLCTYVLIIEISGKSFVPYLVGLYETSYIFGYFTLPIIAYYLREWRYLQLATSAPWLFVIVYYWLIPESPRWLITVGKKKEAIDALTHIARRNNLPTENIAAAVDQMEQETMNTDKPKYGSYLDLFKTPKIRTFSMIIAFIWMFCSHTFFGINQYIGRLQGNLYLNVILSAASLAPAVIFVVFASIYFSRKLSVIFSFSVAGLSLLVFTFLSDDKPVMHLTFAIIGQIGAYCSFVLIYLYTSEVFPTIIRNSALGFASVFARFGSFIAPFVVNIGVEWISIVVFSVLAFSAAFLCCFLPETKNMVLLNTVDQTERTHKKQSVK